MTDDPNYVREERTTIVQDTAPADNVTYVRERSSAAPWIIAAVVAVVAILAVLFLMNNREAPVDNAEDIAAALEANRAAGYIEGATSAMSNQMPAPAPILVPSYDSGAAERSAADAAEAARDARDAAERAADSLANGPDTSVSSNTTP